MFSIIVAISENGIIGLNNKLIWHISSDLKRFKEITKGHKIVMGRKTFESLPGVLPKRENIVITRSTINNEKITVVNDIDKFIKDNVNSEEEIFIIGGATIYKQFEPYCNKIYLTRVLKHYIGDTRLDLNLDEFDETESSEILEENGIKFKFVNLERRK